MATTDAILTENLSRTFKKKRNEVMRALTEINISVAPGQIYGFLGPNGAGKTTLIKILATLLYPSSGRAFVGGYDVVAKPHKVRPLINMVSGGETSGYGILKVYENIYMFSRFYGIPSKVAKERIDHYLKKFDLANDARTKINRISTGMRQKMNLIRGLVTDPQILFLDEPTLGLDVQIAREVRSSLLEWVSENPSKTVFLTTHYMAEADQMCHNIAIIDRGRIVASDTPAGLRKTAGGENTYRLWLKPAVKDLSLLQKLPVVHSPYFGRRDEKEDSIEVCFAMDNESGLTDVLAAIKNAGHQVLRFAKEEASLEDLFIKIVGRHLAENE